MSATCQNAREGSFSEQLNTAWQPVQERARLYRDGQLALEAASDALTKAFEKWESDPDYFETHDLIPWVRRAARWKTLDEFRRRQRFRPLPADDGPRQGRAGADVRRLRPNPLEPIARDIERVARSLQRLAPRHREVLEGHFYDGLTDAELGTRLFGDKGTAQARGLRAWRLRQEAQRRLKEILLEDEEFDAEQWCESPRRRPA